VLCPAYNCGHEVEPLLRRGVQVDFYAVAPDLSIDLQDLERRIEKRTRAVLLTHYFGFPQAIDALRALCDERGLYLIEDCAHALYSRGAHGYLGTQGDVAVFSMRKTIPLPNGGALVVNRPGIPIPQDLRAPYRTATWLKAGDLCKKWLLQHFSSPIQIPIRVLASGFTLASMGMHVLKRLGLLSALAVWDPDDEDFGFNSTVLDWMMAGLGRRIIANADAAMVVERRRRNYSTLLKGMQQSDVCRPVLQSLPQGVCPLFFPLLVCNRDELVATLNRRAIYAAKWWETFHPAVPWDTFPTAVFLKHHVVALPVHQFLNDAHMCRILEVLYSVTRPRRCAR
jgi:dTDP-4-amino-4,6-dideoxygalactose transaminase